MAIIWGPLLEQLVPLLQDAAGRGVEVRLVGDVYSKLQSTQPRLSRAKLPGWTHTKAVNKKLLQHGVSIAYIGRLGLNPFAKRTHSKITIVDDQIYTFGGVNFTEDSFTYADYMLEIHDRDLADRLYELVRAIERDERLWLPNHSQQLSDTTTLLFDGGEPRKSIIYDTACEIVDNAKKVYYVSQMCPSGRLASLINATENKCYFDRPQQSELPGNLALAFDAWRFGIANLYKGQKYVHAKFILTEGNDGSKHVLSGSNNFSWRGIAYGTKEIAVHSTDPELWQTFYDFMQKEIVHEP